MKLLLALGLAAGSPINVRADEDIKFNYEVWGNPEYIDQITEAMHNIPDGLQEYLRDLGVEITILEGENDAETVYAQEIGEPAPGAITGVTLNYADGEKVIYSEGSKHSNHYPMYLDRNPDIDEKDRITEDELCSRIAIDTIYHEMWHAFDFAEGLGLCSSPEIYEIYNSEVENFKQSEAFKVDNLGVTTNVSNTQEFVATFGSAWLTAQSNPDYYEELTTLCPEAYNYMESYVNSIEERYTRTR